MSPFTPLSPRPLSRALVLKTVACGLAAGFLSTATAEEAPVNPAATAPPAKAAAALPARDVSALPAETSAATSVAASNVSAAPPDKRAAAGSPGTPLLLEKSETIAETATRPSTDHELLLTNIIHEFNESIRSGNFIEAEAKLNVLRALLPEKSLTLLRMRAWYAMSSGDHAEAKKLYRQLLGRITADENAGINLAILEARDGRMDEALRILSDLSDRGVSSEQLNAVKKAFGQTVSEFY